MKYFAAALAALLALSSAPAASAAGDATRFIVRVQKIELKDASGNWVTVSDEPTMADILADEPLLESANDGRVPPGEYVGFRITLSETVLFSGSDGEHKTREGGALTFGGTAPLSTDIGRNEVKTFRQDRPTATKDAEGLVSQHLNLDYQDRDDVMEIVSKRPFPKTVVVKEKSSLKITMGLELRKSVRYAWADYFSGIPSDEAVYFVPPREVSEVTVKSDTTTALVTGEAIEWSF